jgi:hypothetical protein
VLQRRMEDGNAAWGRYNGTYAVPAGQFVTRFQFGAVRCVRTRLFCTDSVRVFLSTCTDRPPSMYGAQFCWG